MSLWGKSRQEQRDFQGLTADEYIRLRNTPDSGIGYVSNDTAMRHSAVWACIRVRADLESTLPVDVFRDIDNHQVQMSRPPVLVSPGGERWPLNRWMYATRQDLDRAGNAIGLITERNAITSPKFPQGLPSRIDLQDIASCSVIESRTRGLRYKIHGVEYEPWQVWHEVQFPVAGLPVGLSPIAHAAWSIGEYNSMQQFALDWFRSGGVPKARMKNTARKLTDVDRANAKNWWRDTIANGDLLVTGADWEYSMIQSQVAGIEWLEGRRANLSDITRFFGCPADLVDAEVSHTRSNITYANVSQRNLQFLIMHLGPGIIRREEALSSLLPAPRYVKLNTDALLRLDPQTRGATMDAAITARRMTVSEARALDNRLPLTTSEESEFARLFGDPNAKAAAKAQVVPVSAGTPAPTEGEK